MEKIYYSQKFSFQYPDPDDLDEILEIEPDRDENGLIAFSPWEGYGAHRSENVR